jgi:hypothetical protein
MQPATRDQHDESGLAGTAAAGDDIGAAREPAVLDLLGRLARCGEAVGQHGADRCDQITADGTHGEDHCDAQRRRPPSAVQ